MKKKIRLKESELVSLIERIVVNEAFDPPKHQRTDNKFITKTMERLEDAYMKRDWMMVREVISDLKYKLRN